MTTRVGKHVLLPAYVKQYYLSLTKICKDLPNASLFCSLFPTMYKGLISQKHCSFASRFTIQTVLYLVLFTLSKRDVLCVQFDSKKE